eukprot:scaffold9098_cov124-Isochrysis_galbana.AAC.1
MQSRRRRSLQRQHERRGWRAAPRPQLRRRRHPCLLWSFAACKAAPQQRPIRHGNPSREGPQVKRDAGVRPTAVPPSEARRARGWPG